MYRLKQRFEVEGLEVPPLFPSKGVAALQREKAFLGFAVGAFDNKGESW